MEDLHSGPSLRSCLPACTCLSSCLSVFLSVCLSVFLPVHQSACLPAYLSVCLVSPFLPDVLVTPPPLQLTLALRYIHKEKCVTHRDLTPSNVMLGDGDKLTISEGGKEGGREGRREGGREGRRDREREGGREGGREGEREGEERGGKEGGKEVSRI